MPSKIRPHRVFVGKKGKLHIKLNSKKTSINSSNAKVKNVINIMIKHGPRSRRTQPKKQVEQAMVSPPLAPVYINKLGDPMKDPIYNPQKSLTTDNEENNTEANTEENSNSRCINSGERSGTDSNSSARYRRRRRTSCKTSRRSRRRRGGSTGRRGCFRRARKWSGGAG